MFLKIRKNGKRRSRKLSPQENKIHDDVNETLKTELDTNLVQKIGENQRGVGQQLKVTVKFKFCWRDLMEKSRKYYKNFPIF